MHWNKIYLPEIHDVSPLMETSVADLATLLPAAARASAALMLVPDWQGRCPIDKAPDFSAKLAEAADLMVLHGLTHSRGTTWISKLLYNQDDRAEFKRLSLDEATHHLSKAEHHWFAAFGSKPLWFCAPRWEQSAGVTEALRSRGFVGYFTASRIVRFLKCPVPVPTMNFDLGGRHWMSHMSRPARRRQARTLIDAGTPFRLALHPTDPLDPAKLEEIKWLTDRLHADGWTPVTLDQMLSAYDATDPAA